MVLGVSEFSNKFLKGPIFWRILEFLENYKKMKKFTSIAEGICKTSVLIVFLRKWLGFSFSLGGLAFPCVNTFSEKRGQKAWK